MHYAVLSSEAHHQVGITLTASGTVRAHSVAGLQQQRRIKHSSIAHKWQLRRLLAREPEHTCRHSAPRGSAAEDGQATSMHLRHFTILKLYLGTRVLHFLCRIHTRRTV